MADEEEEERAMDTDTCLPHIGSPAPPPRSTRSLAPARPSVRPSRLSSGGEVLYYGMVEY